MSKRENKRIRQLERRVEKLERILCDKSTEFPTMRFR